MKKLILASLAATLALTACGKKEETKAAEVQTQAEHKHNEHDGHDHKEHEHDHHGHDHAHDHHHHAGDKFQCGDKSVNIAVHNHDGEIEAHLTADDITYDLSQDTQNEKRFITDDGIEGEDKPMTLVLDGDNAQVLKADNSVLLDCKKAS